MATGVPLTSLPAIRERDSSGQDAKDASAKSNKSRDSRIERYLESTEIHFGKVLQWDVSQPAGLFGEEGIPPVGRHETFDVQVKPSAPEPRKSRERSKTEPIPSSFPAAKQASIYQKPRAKTEHHHNKTWPKRGVNSAIPSNKEVMIHTETFGKIHRENLDFMARQSKQAHKLAHDNMAAKQALSRAHEVIQELRAKINRRNAHIANRREKEGDLVDLVENLRRGRDDKLQEYKALVKGMNVALKEKEKLLEQMEAERAKAEMLYQRQLTQNTELLRKIEAREKAIKSLREKTGKVKKWKDEARS